MASPRASPASLSIVIPALDAADTLPPCLAAVATGRASGLAGEVVVVDGGSRDGTAGVAAAWGARVVVAPRGRGGQLAAGAAQATGDWLLFLHADTRLSARWEERAAAFIADPANAARAAHFRLRFDDGARAARVMERVVALRCRWLGLPYGDQGLLLSRRFYDALGGFRPMPLMEDVDLARRIGRARLVALAADAVTSAARYRRDGYAWRVLRNLACLGLYYLGLPPRLILRLYA